MQKIIDLSHRGPEFDAFTQEAVIACIGAGAAKFSGIIGPDSIERLVEDGVTNHPSLLVGRVPELKPFFALLGVDCDSDSPPGNCQISELDLPGLPATPNKPLESHADDVAPVGFTLLVPFEGGDAILGADERKFGENTPAPSFLATYGIGDAMLLRQSVTTFPDEYFYDQINHLGISSSDRTLLAIDVLRHRISVELNQETSGLGV